MEVYDPKQGVCEDDSVPPLLRAGVTHGDRRADEAGSQVGAMMQGPVDSSKKKKKSESSTEILYIFFSATIYETEQLLWQQYA